MFTVFLLFWINLIWCCERLLQLQTPAAAAGDQQLSVESASKSPRPSGASAQKDDRRSRQPSRQDEEDSDGSEKDKNKSDADIIRELRADLKYVYVFECFS